MLLFVILGKKKSVNFHRLMTKTCKPRRNEVYSRLLGDRNECGERRKLDVLPEGIGQSAGPSAASTLRARSATKSQDWSGATTSARVS